jgi:hypothetical protein
VTAAGDEAGIDPDVLVGMALKESTLNSSAQSSSSSASGLFQLTSDVQGTYGLRAEDAVGTSPSAITNQVNAAAGYLYDLTQGQVPMNNPANSLEIALGYFRGSRRGVNRAMASPGGYPAMLQLSYKGETLGSYINYVESYSACN